MDKPSLSRRRTLAGALGVGVSLPVLAACGGDTVQDPGSGSVDPSLDTEVEPGPLAATADVPVGGGTIFADAKVVVTQPTEGDFQGFSAVCTHSGCILASVSDGTINCRCHGSKFSIEDGSVQGGPAPAPLPSVEITVDGGEITVD